MTESNLDMPPGQPDDSEPHDYLARDALDFIDETVARITGDDIEDRLHKTLRRTGYQATDEVRAARREAKRIIADARELADRIINDARNEAQEIRAGVYARKALTAPRDRDEVIRVSDSRQQLRDLQDLIAKLDDVNRKLAIPVRAWHDTVAPRGH
jgi:vacuolar-type H+-ATPase subunit H